MGYRGLIAVGAWVALAAPVVAQVPGLRLGEPIASPDSPRPEPRPLDDRDAGLPPRARLKYVPDGEPKQVTEVALAEARGAERDRERPPPKMADLFDYLSDRQQGEGRAEGRTVGLGRPFGNGSASPSDRPGGTTRLVGDSKGWFTGERLGRIFGKGNGGLFQSDHGFDQFTSPISNPFLFEDPRSLTEVRAIGLYQRIPGSQPNFLGGDAFFGGLQARVAFTERLSLSMTKLGIAGVNPRGQSVYDGGTGLAELWLGPKYTFYRDPEFASIISGGVQFQVPLGSGKAFQDTGTLSIVPYVSAGQNFLKTRFGSLNALGNAGYAVSVNNKRSDYFYASGHLSMDVMNRQKFFPILEVNWVQVTTDGKSRVIAGEGRDLVNFGGLGKGSQLLTGAAGLRWRITKSLELGGAYEFPLVGNRDFLQNRFLVDLTWRY